MKSMRNPVVSLLLLALLLPAAGLAEIDEERIVALEARLETLEEQMDSILSGDFVPEASKPDAFALNETLTLEDGKRLTVTGFETGAKFKYSPAGGFSSLSLAAKSGYRLLCLYLTVENDAAPDLYTSALLDSTIYYGATYTNKARDTFFYKLTRGGYAGGLKSIGPMATVEGCLLYAVPEDVDATDARIAVRFSYGSDLYECVLRDCSEAGSSVLDAAGDPSTF